MKSQSIVEWAFRSRGFIIQNELANAIFAVCECSQRR